jgi:hypothetical protein
MSWLPSGFRIYGQCIYSKETNALSGIINETVELSGLNTSGYYMVTITTGYSVISSPLQILK